MSNVCVLVNFSAKALCELNLHLWTVKLTNKINNQLLDSNFNNNRNENKTEYLYLDVDIDL